MVEVRTARLSDAEIVARIYIESWNEGFGHLLGRRHHSPAIVGRWRSQLVADTVRWAVAETDSSVVGFVGVGPSRDPVDPILGELNTIAVDPAHWRDGIGRLLMEHALEALESSWDKAILWTPARYERGHAFYEAMGWASLGWNRRDGTEVAFGRDL